MVSRKYDNKQNKNKARKIYIHWRKNIISNTKFKINDYTAQKKIDASIKIYINEIGETEFINKILKGDLSFLTFYIKDVLKKDIKSISTYSNNFTENKPKINTKNNNKNNKTNNVRRTREPNPYMKHALHSDSDYMKLKSLLPCRKCGISTCKNKNNC